MTKGKAKINNSSVNLAPPQPWSLRSRKRESDEISETDATHHHHQDTEGNNTPVDATLLQCHHSPLQESTVNVSEEQEETNVTDGNSDSHLEGKHNDGDANTSGKEKEEISANDGNASPSDPQLQLSEPGDTLEEQLGAKQKQEASQEEPGNVYMADVKEVKKEATVGMPAKKKRRMGMCGLTGKERSHFLQIQKRENGQNGVESGEKQICNNTADLEDQEEIISSSPTVSPSLSIPMGSVTENDQAEINLGSSCCGGDDRVETEVHIGATTSDDTSDKSDPGCSEAKSCQVEGDTLPGLEQGGDMSDPPAEEEEEELLENQEQQQQQGGTAEIVAQKPREDGSEAVDQSPAVSSSNPTKNEETENGREIEAALPEVNIVTRDERQEELMTDAVGGDGAEAGDSSIGTRAGGFNTVELCPALLAPTGPERKDDEDPDKEPGTGPPVNVEPSHTRDTTEPFGNGCLDYVSDSQLNTIVLIEDVMEKAENLGSPNHEDATDLVRGLISELSSLNHKVMAAHRELENLRRGSKSSRRSVR